MSPSVDDLMLRHFGLRENPFGVTPDPRFLFMSRTHREALASLVNGIECGFGFQVLVAQPGMGKTTLLFDFLERFHTSRTAFLFQQQHDPREFLQSLLMELKSDCTETSQAKLYGELNNLLSEAAHTGRRVIVVVDEAQNLDDTMLETLRQLSNFETARSKLLQIVLAGQPQLAKKLGRPEQEQLRQRISTIARLSPLGLDETRTYLNHRLNIAGYRGPQFFTRAALYLIWSRGQGIPRNINTLCFNAMLVAFAQKAKRVDEQAIKEAVQDLDLEHVLADIAGNHQPAHGPEDSAPKPGINLLEKKSNRTRPPVVRPSTSEGRRLFLTDPIVKAEPIVKPVPQPSPEFALAVGGDRRNSAEMTKSRNEPQLVPPLSMKVDFQPAIAKPGAGVTSITSARLATAKPATPKPGTPNGDHKLQIPEVAVVAGSPHPASLAVAGPSYRSSLGRRVAGALLVAAAVGAGVLFGHGLSTRAQRASEEHPEMSSRPQPTPDPQPLLDAPVTRTPKNTESTWNAEDGPEVVVRTFPQAAPRAPEGTAQANVKAIFFEGDSSVVSSRYDVTLQRIAEILAANPESNALIEGHTDTSGVESYNVSLSTRRAQAVRDVLVNDYQISPGAFEHGGGGLLGAHRVQFHQQRSSLQPESRSTDTPHGELSSLTRVIRSTA